MVRYGFRDYLAYMKDNPEGYWFKRKLYGWGWVPVSREGWAVTLGFLAAILSDGLWLSSLDYPSGLEIGVFLGILFGLIVGLIGACLKMGEKPAWTWGR